MLNHRRECVECTRRKGRRRGLYQRERASGEYTHRIKNDIVQPPSVSCLTNQSIDRLTNGNKKFPHPKVGYDTRPLNCRVRLQRILGRWRVLEGRRFRWSERSMRKVESLRREEGGGGGREVGDHCYCLIRKVLTCFLFSTQVRLEPNICSGEAKVNTRCTIHHHRCRELP